MTEIKQLPPHVVNKIAAGEVVERPASMVKELIENAIDSGATRIDLILRESGTAEVRVVDNGSGIAPDQLAMAVTSHATSKIESDDDLFDVTTLGFRGEALASIGSVAHLRIRSRTAESDAGNELQVDGGAIGEVTPVAAAAGTTVAVSDLFFNTPVRRKFLRTIRTELGHCTEIFTRLSLAHPHIHFSLTHEERLLHDLPPVADLRERIAHFFGRPLADKLLKIDSREGEIEITGYVAHPQESRPNTKMQYLLLGGRFIRDRSLQHALGEAYRGLLLRGTLSDLFSHASHAYRSGRRECASDETRSPLPQCTRTLPPTALGNPESVSRRKPKCNTRSAAAGRCAGRADRASAALPKSYRPSTGDGPHRGKQLLFHSTSPHGNSARYLADYSLHRS